MKLPSQKILIASVAGLLASSLAHATDVTWSSATWGNWSDTTKWSGGTVPAKDGSSKLIFAPGNGQTFSTGVDDTINPWAINGIEYSGANITNSTAVTIKIVAGTIVGGAHPVNTSATLSVGSGGLALKGPQAGTIGIGQVLQIGSESVSTNVLTLNTTADQTWQVVGNKDGNISPGDTNYINIYANLTGNNVITIQGVTDISATDRGSGTVKFMSGNSTGFTGSFVLKSGGLWFNGPSQLDRLGSNALTVYQNTSGHNNNNSTLTFDAMNSASQEFENAIAFVDEGGSRDGSNLVVNSTAAPGSTLNFSGNLSGAINHTLNIKSANKNLTLVLQGNNSALTSTKVPAIGGSAGAANGSPIYIQYGLVLLENANSLGLNNSLAVSMGIGSTNADPSLSTSSLYANSGADVNSQIYLQATGNTTKAPIVNLGLNGTGSVSYKNAITLRNARETEKASTLYLLAQSSGTLNISGSMINLVATGNTDYSFVPVVAYGGGVVKLSGANTYKGVTYVEDGTTLLAGGNVTTSSTSSSTGVGGVKVGHDSASVAATTTLNSSLISVTSTAGLVVGQSISGTNIPAGARISYIGSNFIEMTEKATAAGSITLNGAAAAGILGGTGRIAPGAPASGLAGVTTTQQTITVSAGSSIAPGEVGQIGALTLDSALTTAALLTMQSGASFTFNLGTADTSDQLLFWNFADGDLVLNDNVINLTDVQVGTYTLMSFFSNNGTTGVDNSLVSGFLTNLTLGGVNAEAYDAQLSTSGNSLILTVAAVPEPATWAMMVGGLGLLALRMRRRMA